MLTKMCESRTENHCLTILRILIWSLVSEITYLMHGYKKNILNPLIKLELIL